MDENIWFWRSHQVSPRLSSTLLGQLFLRRSRVPVIRSGRHWSAFPEGEQRANSIFEDKNDGGAEGERQTRAAVHFPRGHERAATGRGLEGKRPSCIPISTKYNIRRIDLSSGSKRDLYARFLVNLPASSGISSLSPMTSSASHRLQSENSSKNGFNRSAEARLHRLGNPRRAFHISRFFSAD